RSLEVDELGLDAELLEGPALDAEEDRRRGGQLEDADLDPFALRQRRCGAERRQDHREEGKAGGACKDPRTPVAARRSRIERRRREAHWPDRRLEGSSIGARPDETRLVANR